MTKNKSKLLDILRQIDPIEATRLDSFKTKEILDTFSNEEHDSGELVREVTAAISKAIGKYHATLMSGLSDAFSQHGEMMSKYLKSLEASVREGHPKDFSGFFKDIGVQLVEGNIYSKKTSELITNLKWNSSMQIRGTTTGSPIDPLVIGHAIAVGNGTVTTSGTAVQLSATSIPCTRVIICNSDANGSLTNNGTLVVGDSTVVAASATRKGVAIFAGNKEEFHVSDLKLLWLDATDNSTIFNIYYEKFS